MAFSCNTTLRALLNGATDKLAWAQVVNDALGNARRIRCFRDNDPNALDPSVTGVEFRNVGSSGALATKAGAIVKLGRINNATIQLGADVFTGKSCLVIEGNGNWIMGSLGPSAAAQLAAGTPAGQVRQYDFEVEKNFTASNGFGVKANLSISGPRFLPSGPGLGAPEKTDDMPHYIDIYNWTNPAAPVLAGTVELDTRIDNFVYEDAEMAAEVGDAAVYRCSQVAKLAEFDFAATMNITDKRNARDGQTHMCEVQIAAAVSPERSTWTTYPDVRTFDPAQHVTIPPAFKAVIRSKAGTVLKIHELHQGVAINSKRAYHGSWNATDALQPNFTVGMQLVWRNTNPRMSSRANKWMPGLIPEGIRPSRAKIQFTGIGVEPLITGGYQGNSANGMHNMFATRQWPQPRVHQNPLPRDPYGVVDTEFNRSGSSSENMPWADGWDYEPGSFSGHNWYTGPGGPRFDRGPIPSILAWYLTDPNGFVLQENVPLYDRANAWSLAYANHSNHWCRDPRTMQLARNDTELIEKYFIGHQYYSNGMPINEFTIDSRGNMRDGDNSYHYDKNGQFFWMGWSRDGLHSYGSAGWPALIFNSPMMTFLSKWDTFWQLQQGGGGTSNYRQDYMVRSQAWLWLHYTLAWKLASNHPLGMSRDLIETTFVRHLTNLHDNIIVPVFDQNEDSNYAKGLRNMGQPLNSRDGGWETQGGGLGMYMANVLALMKTTGFWQKIYAKGGKAKRTLDYQIRNMDKYCFDYTLDTSMEKWPSVWVDVTKTISWAAVLPKNGLADAYHDAAGNLVGDRDVAVHPFSTYPYVRKHYFPEFPNERLDATVAKWDAMLGAITDSVNAANTPVEKRGRDHAYGYAGVGIWKAPTEPLA